MAGSAVIGALRVSLGLDTGAFTEGLNNATAQLGKVGKQLTGIGKSLSLKVTAPLALAGGLILKTAGDFEASMNRVGAALGASSDEMARLSDLARDLGKSTVFSAVEAADAIEMLAKNGVSTADILGGALAASLDLAAASGSDLAGAADLATDVMLNFNKGVADLGGVVDGVSGVLLASKFGFDDYRLALAQAGGVAGGLGVTLDDFNAVIAATSARFASGSDAGTAFKTFLQRLVPQSKAAASAMQELGLEFFNADGSMKSMAEVAQELQDALSDLSDEDKSAALTKIFGTDALRTAIGLMEAGASGVRDLDAAISSASAAEQAAARTNGWAGALEELGGAFDELKLAIAESGLLEMATSFVRVLTDIIDRMSEANPGVLQFGVIFGGLAAAFGPVLVALGLAATAVAAVGIPVAAVVAGIAALTAAVIAFWPEIVRAKDAVIAFGTEALDWIKAKVEEIVTTFTTLRERMMQIGRDLLQGLWDGMIEKWEALKKGIGSIANGITSTFKGWLGIESPSTVFHEIGVNLMQGLGNGIVSAAGVVTSALEGVTAGATGAMQGILGAGEQVAQGFGQVSSKVLKTAQVFGAAQALVNTYVAASQTLADPTLGFWAKFAAVAKVIATGLGFVAAIKGGGRGSSGGGGGSSSSRQRVATPAAGATAEKPKAPLDVRMQPLDPNALFTGKTVSDLLTSLQREAGDRGLRLAIA